MTLYKQALKHYIVITLGAIVHGKEGLLKIPASQLLSSPNRWQKKALQKINNLSVTH